MIGARSSNSENIAGALRERFDIQFVDSVRIPNPRRLRGIDVVYGVHLQTCSRYIAIAETLHKKTVIHFVGSDAYRYSQESGPRKTFWKHVVNRCDLLFFVSSHLRHLVGKDGPTLAIPLHKDLFIEANPIPVKAALAMMGMIEEVSRLPLVPMSDKNREKLRAALTELALI